ncbi:diadenylate cyclase CdaA [Geobacter sp.]|uniref:diadenylate cyclase CdaA n=1 Tax=Geobacter sp. TaxID=46610 RepID=UPI001AC6CA46|nr:diadenylate cyclase CdaA [Geobacter sp.]CAG0981173.1 Cyclic di-AMP synthase CdaA [Geobacteraceae bacterium]
MSDSLQLFGWRDLIDIMVVAFVIYRIILLLKGKVAARLLLIIVILATLYFLTGLAGFDALHWILSSLFGSFILILVIIFQHDLRRALVTLGRSSKGREYEMEEASEAIDGLITAMTDLSARRHGALIVIEREMGVSSHLETGTEIDAKITSEILASIFLPYSPIHDGAVVIQRGKLTRAGCFLPLSQNPTISKTLGTRHRAALGLTEVVDAVALVVSEETGQMSVVAGGKLTPMPDGGSLRKALKRLVEPRWLVS